MRKKFAVLSKDIEDHKEEIRALHCKEKDLQVIHLKLYSQQILYCASYTMHIFVLGCNIAHECTILYTVHNAVRECSMHRQRMHFIHMRHCNVHYCVYNVYCACISVLLL
jgi:hypothetical protein